MRRISSDMRLGKGGDTAVEGDGTYLGYSTKLGMNGQQRGEERSKNRCLLVFQALGSRRCAIASGGAAENKKDVNAMAARWVTPETVCITDQGGAFNDLSTVVGGPHLTNNHSKGLKDKRTGVHSNVVESRNKQIKEFLKCQGRTFAQNDSVLWGNLTQYMFQQWFTDGSGTMKFSMFLLGMFDLWGFI
jgi:hypothetical protein